MMVTTTRIMRMSTTKIIHSIPIIYVRRTLISLSQLHFSIERNMPITTIILDIDETLIHAFGNKKEIEKLKRSNIWNSNPLLRARTFTVYGGPNERWWVVKRPNLDEFIDMCFAKFDQVIVWTAGCKEYADDIVSHVFSGHPQPHYVFCREHCADYEEYDKLHKPILSLRKYGVRIDPEYTFIVDDRQENFIKNKDNGIRIREYLPPACLKQLEEDRDNSLKTLIQWMKVPNFRPHVQSCPRLA
jgi:TFIIF-interacting CTD phosphatase-like protein